MAQEGQEWIFIVDQKEEWTVTPSGGNPTLSIARFLKPSVTCLDQVPEIPMLHHMKLATCPSDIRFKGWKFPQRKWKNWVNQMSLMYEPIWRTAGIYESIISSTYQIRKEKSVLLGLTEFWCPHTNTFVFPWGEATMTLEDMFILGGYSVLGEPVTSPLTGDLFDIHEKIMDEHKKFWKYKVAKPCHSEWIKRFMDSNSELEHVAFLSLWLSRYVFPTYPDETLSQRIFPIAIRLSRAMRVALAPAVLASLYRDLRVLKQHVVASITTAGSSNDQLCLSVWAPFTIMQMWAWEHLPNLQPKPNFNLIGEPRAARWHKMTTSKFKLESVRSTLNSIENFEFRPYPSGEGNWSRPSFYKEQGEWIFDILSVNEELQSFSRFIMACELVGLDCIEQYLPHRVAMQFGMVQDLPGHFARANSSWEVAWSTYDKPNKNVTFYLPPCPVDPKVTVRYFKWWKTCFFVGQDASQNTLEQKQSSRSFDNSDEFDVPPPGFPKKRWWEWHSSSAYDNSRTSQRFRHFEDSDTINARASASSHNPSSSTQFQSPPPGFPPKPWWEWLR